MGAAMCDAHPSLEKPKRERQLAFARSSLRWPLWRGRGLPVEATPTVRPEQASRSAKKSTKLALLAISGAQPTAVMPKARQLIFRFAVLTAPRGTRGCSIAQP
jgi:hypothetical protein